MDKTNRTSTERVLQNNQENGPYVVLEVNPGLGFSKEPPDDSCSIRKLATLLEVSRLKPERLEFSGWMNDEVSLS